jgi:TolB-like protein
MASLIEGYEYDIFISYRQKDNKYDGWVTTFVDNLKKELEATFKEDISIYFDENPHDGLLEMHDVDKSLEGKLKSLVFIPIISQTYCDPKSFAWNHEFCEFNRRVKEDLFGRDIKLAGGNVSSRILPVKINDLDPEDMSLIENELGGVLRAVEFIYKEPGVNRPLTPDDDEQKNLNKTKYRNQINKVANAVKEIIKGIKDPDANIYTEKTKNIKTEPSKRKLLRKKVVLPTAIIIVLLIAVLLFLPSVIRKLSGGLSPSGKSIAVLPFVNLSNDPDQEYFTVGIMDEITNKLSKIGGLSVCSRTSSMSFKDSNLQLKVIAKKLGVANILEGSVRKVGNNVRIIVQLIDAKRDRHLWSETYDREITDVYVILAIQSEVANRVAKELNAAITPAEKQFMKTIPTERLEAYDAYLKGQFYYHKITPNDMDIAMQYFELAKELDPDFALAYVGIGTVWLGRQVIGAAVPEEAGPKVMTAFMKALELDSTIAEVHYTLAVMNTFGTWDWKSAESEFIKAIAINPNYADARALYSHLLNFLGRPKEAMEQIELALKLDPQNPTILVTYSHDLIFVQKYGDVVSVSHELFEKNPTMFVALDPLFQALHLTGRYEEAFEVMKNCYTNMYKNFDHVFDQYDKLGYAGTLSLEGDTLLSQSRTKYIVPLDIAYLYIFAGNKEKALECLEQAYELHDPNLPYITRPTYESLRDEPRFQDLLRKLNLTFNY